MFTDGLVHMRIMSYIANTVLVVCGFALLGIIFVAVCELDAPKAWVMGFLRFSCTLVVDAGMEMAGWVVGRAVRDVVRGIERGYRTRLNESVVE
jgi:hypothetical protein